MPVVVKVDCSHAPFQRGLELLGEFLLFPPLAIKERKRVTGL